MLYIQQYCILLFMKILETICVCGAGTMGSGIAQVCAQAGFNTIVFDVNNIMVDKSKIGIEKNLQYLVDKQKISLEAKQTILNKISFTTAIETCLADVCIEAIIEDKDAKVALFNAIYQVNKPSIILATNTSSISVASIAAETIHPASVVGLHFFNPAHIMKLVEIVQTNLTAPSIVETMLNLCKQLNKVAVVCKDMPGFIVNRVARQYYLEAMKLIELNLATIENVDAIMETSGFKMGPFKLMDLIGMDINFSASTLIWQALGKPERLTPSIIQQNKVATGALGKKSGKGFYTY